MAQAKTLEMQYTPEKHTSGESAPMTAVKTVSTNTYQVSSQNKTTVIMTSTKYNDTKEMTIASNDDKIIKEIEKKKKPYGGRPLRFQCEHCDRRFHAPSHLKRHMLCHSSERPYQCNVCKKGFLQAWHLSRHMTTHTGHKPFSCSECSKTFGSRFEMKTHCNYIHRGIKEHKCEECGKMFTLRSNLKVHMRKHTGEKPYNCDICSKSFGQRGHLQYHMRKHKDSMKTERERTISTGSSSTDFLDEYSSGSSNDKDHLYDSGIDAESTVSGRNSTKHLPSDDENDEDMNENDEADSVDLVEKREEMPLSSRIFDHTDPNELKPFVCNSCNCGFGEISSLIAHVRHSHSKKGIVDAIYSCAYCDCSSFNKIENLNTHYQETHVTCGKYEEDSACLSKQNYYEGKDTDNINNDVNDEKNCGLTTPNQFSGCTCERDEIKFIVQERYLAYLNHYHQMLESRFQFMQALSQEG